MTQYPNNQNGGQGGSQAQNGNGYQGRGGNNRGNFSPPRNQYDWLVQQRIRLEMDMQRLILQQQHWQGKLGQIVQMRTTGFGRKLGLAMVASVSVLNGNRQVTMTERNHFYRTLRYDQTEQWAQAKLDELDVQIAGVQANLDLIDFEIAMEGAPTNNNGPIAP